MLRLSVVGHFAAASQYRIDGTEVISLQQLIPDSKFPGQFPTTDIPEVTDILMKLAEEGIKAASLTGFSLSLPAVKKEAKHLEQRFKDIRRSTDKSPYYKTLWRLFQTGRSIDMVENDKRLASGKGTLLRYRIAVQRYRHIAQHWAYLASNLVSPMGLPEGAEAYRCADLLRKTVDGSDCFQLTRETFRVTQSAFAAFITEMSLPALTPFIFLISDIDFHKPDFPNIEIPAVTALLGKFAAFGNQLAEVVDSPDAALTAEAVEVLDTFKSLRPADYPGMWKVGVAGIQVHVDAVHALAVSSKISRSKYNEILADYSREFAALSDSPAAPADFESVKSAFNRAIGALASAVSAGLPADLLPTYPGRFPEESEPVTEVFQALRSFAVQKESGRLAESEEGGYAGMWRASQKGIQADLAKAQPSQFKQALMRYALGVVSLSTQVNETAARHGLRQVPVPPCEPTLEGVRAGFKLYAERLAAFVEAESQPAYSLFGGRGILD